MVDDQASVSEEAGLPTVALVSGAEVGEAVTFADGFNCHSDDTFATAQCRLRRNLCPSSKTKAVEALFLFIYNLTHMILYVKLKII